MWNREKGVHPLFCFLKGRTKKREDGTIVPVFYFKSARDYNERRNQVEIEKAE